MNEKRVEFTRRRRRYLMEDKISQGLRGGEIMNGRRRDHREEKERSHGGDGKITRRSRRRKRRRDHE